MKKLLIISLLYSLSLKNIKAETIQSIYDSLIKYNIEEPKISLAIIMYETGWLKCKSCAYKYHNLFGFKTTKGFIRFENSTASILYYKKWQERYWKPYHKKYPNKTYYDFLRYINYCDKMQEYIKTIKHIQTIIKVK